MTGEKRFDRPVRGMGIMNRNSAVEIIAGKRNEKHSPNHIPGFDYLRVAAAFCVVWIHGSDTNPLAKSLQTYTSFAVPCFILMSIILTQESLSVKTNHRYWGVVGKRFQRVLPAYLAWSLVYISMRVAKHEFVSHVPFDINWFSIIFFGAASYQLWYVPALLFWTSLFAFVMVLLASSGRRLILKGVLMIATGVILVRIIPQIQQVSLVIFGEYAHQFAIQMVIFPGYICMGMGVWCMTREFSTKEIFRARQSGILFGAVLLSLAFGMKNIFQSNTLFVPLYAMGLLVSFLFIELHSADFLRKYLAPCSFGIYLCHGIFVEGFQMLSGLGGIDLGSFSTTAGIIVASFICSSILCVGFMMMKPTRWLVV